MASKDTTADFDEHSRTFSLFLRLIKWSVGLIAVALLALFFLFVGNPYT